MSYELKIDPKSRAAGRFIGKVRRELISAAINEKKLSGITQQKIAEALGVNRSVVNRILKGETNLTLRTIAELSFALGYTPEFSLEKPKTLPTTNLPPDMKPAGVSKSSTSSTTIAQNYFVSDKPKARSNSKNPIMELEDQ